MLRTELRLRRHDDAVVVLGVLEIALGRDQVAGSERVAGERHVFLGDMRRGPANFHVGSVRFKAPRQWILGLAATAAAPAILLSLPHRLRCNPDLAAHAATSSLLTGFLSARIFSPSSCSHIPRPRRAKALDRHRQMQLRYGLALITGAKPIVLIAPASLKNRWAVERHLNVPRGTPPFDRGSRGVALVAVCNRPALLTPMAENFKFAGLEPSPNPAIFQVQFFGCGVLFPRHLSHGPAPRPPGASGEVPPRPLLKD